MRKYLRSNEPPNRKPFTRAHLLDPFQEHIDALLRRSPRITAVRIGRYLRENVDASLRVNESTLRKYVARRREQLVPKEAFIRANYAPGDEAQFDFSPVQMYLNDVLTVVQLFAIRLSYSGRYFARISLRNDRVALFTGLLAGLVALGGLPRRAIFDNARTAVIKILRGRNRTENKEFAEFCGAYDEDARWLHSGLIEIHVGAPIPAPAADGDPAALTNAIEGKLRALLGTGAGANRPTVAS